MTVDNPTQPTPRFQIDSLDGLRGLAVIIVFLSHTSRAQFSLIDFPDFQGAGKSGVFLFFILSAFLLTIPFLSKGKKALDRLYLANYFTRRFLRIYPLYLLYLLAALFTSLFLVELFELKRPVGIPFHLSWHQFWDHIILQQGKGVTWSILVEFRYYFILPIVALTYSILLRNKLFPALLLTLAIITTGQLLWPESDIRVNDPRLGPYIGVFAIGSFLGLLYFSLRQISDSLPTGIPALLEIAGLLSIAVLIYLIPSVTEAVTGETVSFNEYHKDFLLFAVLWSFVLLACVSGKGWVQRFFENRLLRYLGSISFSIYLLHVVVIELVKRLHLNIPELSFLISGALTILVSHFSWKYIEKPFSKVSLLKPR